MVKEKLLNYLEIQTAFLDLDKIDQLFSAKGLAEIFKVKRNTVSHYLNQLNESGFLVKINTRPVYYFHKVSFSEHFFPLNKDIYTGIQDIKKERPFFQPKQDLFSLLVGSEKSLTRTIEQIKSALYYPDNGLPVLITGESGTGKSYLVRLVYEYCLEHDLIEEDAPFVTLNCAQYADNPELLTSNLFGHVEGAFTGADKTKIGAFEAANKGILFLDEVHRLNPEGQEKLFTYLDQGNIYRMGDTSHPIAIQTRLFFATTEDLESTFLTTFIRRIPIQVKLPTLEERSRSERIELIYSFFIGEQRRIDRPINISSQVLSLLSNSSFKGNIGELKNLVKVMTANAFAEQTDQEELAITIYHVPGNKFGHSVQNIKNNSEKDVRITSNSTTALLINRNFPKQQRLVHTFKNLLNTFKRNDCQIELCKEILKKEVESLFDYLLFETGRQQKHEILLYMTQYIRETLRQMETAHQIKFNGNSVYAISYYLFQRDARSWQPESIEINQLIRVMESQIVEVYSGSYYYVTRILELCQPKLDLDISSMDKILMTIYLQGADWAKDKAVPKAIIVAHGYATASSISNVANRFLDKEIFEAFDMPLDVTPQQIADEILDYSEYNNISNGLVILVDMGSLKEIYQYFPKQITAPIIIMNNVTTPLAISIGENLQKNLPLKELAEKSISESQLDWEIIYPQENKLQVLLTTCFTGIGTATQISHLLERSLPQNSELKIFPYEYELLERNKHSEAVFSMYEVVGIVGTADPVIEDIPYITLESLISGDKEHILTKWLSNVLSEEEQKAFNANIIRNFSLEKVIDSVTILDTDKVMKEIELFMRELEENIRVTLTNAQRLSLYVHISCLIERLIRNIPIETYKGYDELYQCQKEYLFKIKRAFSVIEKDYSVKIPDSELAYIYDILKQTVDNSAEIEEF
ncbi:sigma 54-interacting transcriptional regulator [Enterococcus hermanniensis]|uniref:sigma 54-interacting transcriptional regulator n=1 Tax=Enterococcus hermanniensis TaxID=249189 RepID=UPI001B80E075|nr:sigma-54-dependent transcriptional regulator [Enterococcus hermanniensis]